MSNKVVAISRRIVAGRAVVLNRTRIFDKYSETFMMAGALPVIENKHKTSINNKEKKEIKF